MIAASDPCARHHRIASLLVAGVLAAVAQIAHAQTAASKPLTVDEAVRSALANSPRREVAAGREDAARAGVGEARSAYLPDINLAAEVSGGFGGSVTAAMGVRGIMGSPYTQNFGAGAEGSWTVYDFGRRERAVDAAHAAVDAARAYATLDRRAIALNAIAMFERAGRAQIAAARLQVLVDVRRRGADQAKALADAGLRPAVDMRLAQARALDSEAQFESARGEEQGARAALAAALGTRVAVKEPLDVSAPPDEEIAHSAGEGRAPENPLRDIANAERERARSLHSLAVSEHLPKLVVAGSAGYARRDPDPGYWAAGAAIVVPLFTYARQEARADAEAGRARAAAGDAEQADLDLRSIVVEYVQRIEATRRALSVAREGVDAAKASTAASEARYSAGQLSFIEVDEARVQVVAAQGRFDELSLTASTTVARLRALQTSGAR